MKKVTFEQLLSLVENEVKENNSRWETPAQVEAYYLEVETLGDSILVRPQFNDSFYDLSDYARLAEALGFSTWVAVGENSDCAQCPVLHIH